MSETKLRPEAAVYVHDRIEDGDSFTVVGIPGAGKSAFFRFITKEISSDSVQVANIDLNEIEIKSNEDIYSAILKAAGVEGKNILEFASEIKGADKKVVLLFDRFEKAVNLATSDFFDTLRAVIERSERKIIFVCSVYRDLKEIRSYQDIDQFYTLVGNFTLYLKPYTKEEALAYMQRVSKRRDLELTEDTYSQLYELAGGNSRIINAYIMYFDLHREQSFEQNLEEASYSESVEFQCQRIVDHIAEQPQKTLARIANELPITPIDEKNILHLQNLGVLNEKREIFSKRLQHYLRSQSRSTQPGLHMNEDTGELFKDGERLDPQLSSTEYAFLAFMIENNDRIVDRDEIAEAVWGSSQEEGVSDEAIDQLVSRVREKIEPDKANPKHLVTLRGRGFQLKS